MSDFSELCPLFDTGVFGEFTFPEVSLTSIGSANENALMFSANEKASSSADFNFGRTVIITEAWVRVRSAPAGSGALHLIHCSTMRADGTIFGTVSMSTTVVGFDRNSWVSFTLSSTTFDSAAVLGLVLATATSNPGALCDLMIRYKEK